MANTLPVMEVFPTLQGEGKFTGHPAYFIRLGGCDVGCSWCDVKDSWDAEKHPQQTIQSIVEGAVESGLKMVVITGGEPCLYDLSELTNLLEENGLQIHLETSGAHPIKGAFDFITLSPKKFKPCLEENYPKADELKVVVVNRHDLVWAQEQASKVSPQTHLFMQPEWERKDKVQCMMVEYLNSEEGKMWSLSEQTHKYLGIR